VKICDERGVEFFIVADQTERILNEVLDIEEDAWEPFHKGKNQGNKDTKGTGVDSMTAFLSPRPIPLRIFRPITHQYLDKSAITTHIINVRFTVQWS